MKLEYFSKNTFFFRMWFIMFILHRHFLPKGEPIPAQLLRCSGFAVDNHSVTRQRLVTEPVSTRGIIQINCIKLNSMIKRYLQPRKK